MQYSDIKKSMSHPSIYFTLFSNLDLHSRKRRHRNEQGSPTVPATLGGASFLAENHEDTTEGATHLFQDEAGEYGSLGEKHSSVGRVGSPTAPTTLVGASFLAENHEDTTEGATHLFQDEAGLYGSLGEKHSSHRFR